VASLVCRADITSRYETGFRAIFSYTLEPKARANSQPFRELSPASAVTFTCRARISVFNFGFSRRYVKRKFRKNFESHREGQSPVYVDVKLIVADEN